MILQGMGLKLTKMLRHAITCIRLSLVQVVLAEKPYEFCKLVIDINYPSICFFFN